MEDFTRDFMRDLDEIQQEYDREYLTKRLNIVTTKDDDCGGRDRVTTMKYYTVRPKEYFTERHYQEHTGKTYEKYIKTIQPRKFYSETELRNYMALLNRWAGRTLEDDEMRLLLRNITKGRQYDLVCIIDRTEELNKEMVWQDIK